jgi:uncharacterized protein YaiL (DUF2058 family)
MLVTAGLHAQSAQREKVESMRVAFITNRLQLTPEQSKQFWPVYNSYRHDLAQLRRSYFPNEEGADAHLDADRQLEFEQRKLDLKKQYMPQFEQVIGRAKLNKLVSSEEDFKRLLIQTMRNRRQQRPAPGPGHW